MSQPRTLQSEEELPQLRDAPVSHNDSWYRWILVGSEPRPDTSKSKIVKYYQKHFKRPEFECDWLLELSGRLSSLSPEFLSDAQFKVAAQNERLAATGKDPAFRYRGRWIAEVAAIRAAGFDVVHVPTDDPAHANVVIVNDTSIIDETISMLAAETLHDALQFETPPLA